jgi:hypothetical protein
VFELLIIDKLHCSRQVLALLLDACTIFQGLLVRNLG